MSSIVFKFVFMLSAMKSSIFFKLYILEMKLNNKLIEKNYKYKFNFFCLVKMYVTGYEINSTLMDILIKSRQVTEKLEFMIWTLKLDNIKALNLNKKIELRFNKCSFNKFETIKVNICFDKIYYRILHQFWLRMLQINQIDAMFLGTKINVFKKKI